MAKGKSRSQRWADAVHEVKDEVERLREAVSQGNLGSALAGLKGVQEEYEEWRDNLPDSLQSSPMADKLREVCDLDIDKDPEQTITDALDSAMELAENAEGMDLPQGFGRD